MNRRISSLNVISRRASQSGFTLIEVLVSALILYIGIVGVAGLQAMSLKNNQSAYMRSQATALAANLPMGEGFVCIDSTPNDGDGVGNPQCDGAGTQFSVKVWWDDNRDGVVTVTAANTERMAINFQL
jgi:type IV pilus assembly protein PilV